MTTPKLTFGCSMGVEDYWNVAEFARRAEDLGFDRVTMGEHLMDGNPPRPTVLNLPAMAAAAGATSKAREAAHANGRDVGRRRVRPSRDLTLLQACFRLAARIGHQENCDYWLRSVQPIGPVNIPGAVAAARKIPGRGCRCRAWRG